MTRALPVIICALIFGVAASLTHDTLRAALNPCPTHAC